MLGYATLACQSYLAFTELLVAQFMWLDYDNPAKLIYLDINSPGTQNKKMETVGSETEAYAMSDTISAKELDANTECYMDLIDKGTGKTKEQINEDVKRPKYLQAQAAIDYGIADKIADSQDSSFEKRGLLPRELWEDLEEAVQRLQPD